MKTPGITAESALAAARVEKLRARHAAAQAAADQLRAQLVRLEARISGEPAPETGLEMLWKAAPPMARTRSSRYKCRAAWLRIPAAARPRVGVMLDALKAWSKCEEWRKDEGQFVPALDRWIRERRWEDLPSGPNVDPRARYRTAVPPPPPVPLEDQATPEEIASMFATFRKKLI